LNRWLAVGAGALAFFTVCQDVQMVASALPALGRSLAVDPQLAVWLLLAGSVGTVGLLLPAGRWADASGNRGAFLVAIAGYAAGAALAGAALSVPWLLAARAIEGAFTALIVVLVMTIAVEAAGDTSRAVAIGAITAAGPLGSMTGPQLAAMLLPAFGWRAIFLVSVPLMAVTALLAAIAVRGESRLVRPRPRWLLEAAALTTAVTALFLLLRELPQGMAGAVPALGLAVVLVAALAVWSRLPQAHGAFRLVLARRMTLPLGGLATMALTAGVIAYAVPYFLLGDVRASLQAAALAFIALAFGQTLSSAAAGYGIARWGSWPVALAGAAVLAAAVLLLVPLDPGWGPVGVGWRIALIGVGSGLVASSNQSAVMGLAPEHHQAAASAISGVFRNLCYAFGAAVAALFAVVAGAPTGLRVALALSFGAALAGIAAAFRVRDVYERLDAVDHHPAPHATHAAVHKLDGLATHAVDHPAFQEPEPLHPRQAQQPAEATS
jgi:DHA2 family multidrug resistance protein-like MFS transporter